MMGGFLNASLIILKVIVEYATRHSIVDLFNTTYKYLGLDSTNNISDEDSRKSPRNGKFKRIKTSNTMNSLHRLDEVQVTTPRNSPVNKKELKKLALILKMIMR